MPAYATRDTAVADESPTFEPAWDGHREGGTPSNTLMNERLAAGDPPPDPRAEAEALQARVVVLDARIADLELVLQQLEARLPGLRTAAETAAPEERGEAQADLAAATAERDLALQDHAAATTQRDQAQSELQALRATLEPAERPAPTSAPAPAPEPAPAPDAEAQAWADAREEAVARKGDPWGMFAERRAWKRRQREYERKYDAARALAPRAERTAADDKADQAHADKVRNAARAAHTELQSNTGTGNGENLLKALHGLDGKRDLDLFYASYQAANPELQDADRDQVEQHLRLRLATRLRPADWLEATAHLEGDVVEATKAGLKNAIGDVAWLNEAQARHVRELEWARGKMSTGASVFSRLKSMATSPLDGADLALRLVDDKESRITDLMSGLSSAQRLALLNDEDFRHGVREDVDEALEGLGEIDEGSTTVARWRAFSRDDDLREVGDRVEAEARREIRAQLDAEGITTDRELHEKVRLKVLKRDDAAWSRRLDTSYAVSHKGKLDAVDLRESIHGTGEWTDAGRWLGGVAENHGIDLTGDRKAAQTRLAEIEADPTRLDAAMRAYGREDDAAEGLTDLRRDLDAEGELRTGDWKDLALLPFGGVQLRTELKREETANASRATGATADAAEVTLQRRDTLAALAKECGGQAPTPEQLKVLAKEGGRRGELAQEALKLEEKREALLIEQRAAQIVAAAQAGDVTKKGGLVDLLSDPAYRTGLRQVDRALAAGDLTEAEAKKKREELGKQHQARNAKLDRAVARLTEGQDEAYGSVGDLLAREVTDWDANLVTTDEAAFVRQAWDQGYLEPHQLVFLAIDGADTDLARLEEALGDLTPAEIAEVRRKFARDYRSERFFTVGELVVRDPTTYVGQRIAELGDDRFMDEAIRSDVSGDSEHKANKLLLGNPARVFDPKNPPRDPVRAARAAEERLAVEKARMELDLRLERGEGAGFLGGAYDEIEGVQQDLGLKDAAGERLDDQSARLRRWIDDNEGKLEAGDPQAWAEFERRRGYFDADVAVSGQVKSEAADYAEKGLEALAVVASTVASGGTAAAGWAALFGLGAAGLGGLTRWGLTGDRMGEEEAELLGAKALLSAGMAGISDDALKVVLNTVGSGLLAPGALRSDHLGDELGRSLLGALANLAGTKLALGALDDRLRDSGFTLLERKLGTGIAGSVIDSLIKVDPTTGGVVAALFGIGTAALGAHMDVKATRRELAGDPAKYDPKKHGSLNDLGDGDLRAFGQRWTNEQLLAAGVDPKRITALDKERADLARLSQPGPTGVTGQEDPAWGAHQQRAREDAAAQQLRLDAASTEIARLAREDHEAVQRGGDDDRVRLARLRSLPREEQEKYAASLPEADRKRILAQRDADDRRMAEVLVRSPLVLEGLPADRVANLLAHAADQRRADQVDAVLDGLSPERRQAALEALDPEVRRRVERRLDPEPPRSDAPLTADALDERGWVVTPARDEEVDLGWLSEPLPASKGAPPASAQAPATRASEGPAGPGSSTSGADRARGPAPRDPARLREELERFRPDPDRAPTDEVEAAVRDARRFLQAESERPGLKYDPFEPVNLGGLCHDAARVAAEGREGFRVVRVEKSDFADDNGVAHSFVEAEGPDGPVLIDPTFAQFLHAEGPDREAFDRLFAEYPDQVRALVEDGWVPADGEFVPALKEVLARR